MVKSEKVHHAVDQQYANLLKIPVPLFPGLNASAIKTDHHIAQTPGLAHTLPGGFSDLLQFGHVVLRETQHISGFVFPTPLPVNDAHARIGGKNNGQLSLSERRRPRNPASPKLSQ